MNALGMPAKMDTANLPVRNAVETVSPKDERRLTFPLA